MSLKGHLISTLTLLALSLLRPCSGGATQNDTWWSLQPIVRHALPTLKKHDAINPIDRFIRAKLEANNLSPSPAADRATLIRRVYFDVIGLPPTPEEVQRFVADTDPRAYEHLIDRLLASQRYGERWARHWLDVVHYGDTHGYDKDQPRPNAWPYRDYVIRSLNEDKPYSRFVAEQLAGDVISPNDPDALEALGFISAGPWDLIGHAELPETKIDGKIARHLDRDDMVANTMSTFTSLTVHCAQCHDHKFDPISSKDYYSLQAVFAAVDRTNVEYYRDPALTKQRNEWKERERALTRERKELEETIEKLGGQDLAELKKQLESAKKTKADRPSEYGYHSAIETKADTVKWVQVDLGTSKTIRRVALSPCWDDFAGIGEGFGFPVRYRIECSDSPDFTSSTLIHDQTSTDLPNPRLKKQEHAVGPIETSARYIRVTATKLAPRQGDFIFALAELEVFDAAGTNLARNSIVTALDSIEAPVRWAKSNLIDGLKPSSQGGATDISALERKLAVLLETRVDSETRTRWQGVTNSLAQVQSNLAAMPEPSLAFVGAVHYGSGSFRGTGPDGGKPRPIHVLSRGDVKQPRAVAEPGALAAVLPLRSQFDLPAEHPEGERRRALANWITDARNPLTWRSVVNRVWQYHFGRGLVETPNDFGRMGASPSHPELLDWLAIEFRDGGQSFKKLHRLILTSATYQQVSTFETANPGAELDRDNRLLWRMNRRKLEAESLRDSILAISGKLNPALYGPGFRDFVIEKPEHSPHYQYHLHDPDDPRSHRRSIYRFIVRSQQQPFMTTLDCADPSMLVDKRNESLSALQALALLNNRFMLTMSRHFAERMEKEQPDLALQIERAFWLALSRAPSETEQRDLVAFAKHNGMANTCRLLFNLNEFAFVD